MKSPKFVSHYKLSGCQIEELVGISKHFSDQGRYVVSVACVNAKKRLFNVLSFNIEKASTETGGFTLVKVIGVARVEVVS